MPLKSIGLLLMLSLTSLSYAKDSVTVDPAPSGKERSEAHVDTRTNTIVTMPGRDAPVRESRQGNKVKLDFDSKGQPGKDADTTYIIRSPQGNR